MNFHELNKVENASFYLDIAFRNSKKAGEHYFPKTTGDQFERAKKTELEKIKAFHTDINERLNKIIKNFPNIDALPEFYNELIRTTLEYENLKKSLGAINWAQNSITEFSHLYEKKVRRTRDIEFLRKAMKEFYGRVSSIVKQINKNLSYLEECRRTMKTYPAIKTDLFTVAITGFPNIGKSTLLSRITPAKPEIQNYAFTTKGINLGYTQFGIRKLQFIDTPGVLNRNKMNSIEQQAHLVLKYLANVIVYVIDLTEPYSLKEQEKLLKSLKDYDRPIIIYLSKSDIIEIKVMSAAKKKYKAVTTLDDLKKRLDKSIKEFY